MGVTRFIWYGIMQRRSGKFFLNFDEVAREELKTNYSSCRISGMVLSNQSDILLFFRPLKVTLKWGLIPKDDLTREMAKCRKMTCREWLNLRRWHTEIGQIHLYVKQESQKRIWWNKQPKAIFRAIPAHRKPKLIGFFQLNFRGPKNTAYSLLIA